MTLGQKLRQTRLSKGLSQSQVAGGCVTRNMLSQIENDQASPSMRTLEHLARALDVSVGWLLSDEQTDAALEKMRRARTLFREEDYAGCLALFAQDAPSGDEMLLLCSQAAGYQGNYGEKYHPYDIWKRKHLLFHIHFPP